MIRALTLVICSLYLGLALNLAFFIIMPEYQFRLEVRKYELEKQKKMDKAMMKYKIHTLCPKGE